uniref:Sulfotransferase domain-containing protein n=1 Tax=Ditylenchus dipsaci TaxID=166011 RepID=A0A915EFP9_9BILA
MGPQRVIDIKDIEFGADDIVIASYPKSGTTWMAELVSGMAFGGDTEAISKIPQEERAPWLELEKLLVGQDLFLLQSTLPRVNL